MSANIEGIFGLIYDSASIRIVALPTHLLVFGFWAVKSQIVGDGVVALGCKDAFHLGVTAKAFVYHLNQSLACEGGAGGVKAVGECFDFGL